MTQIKVISVFELGLGRVPIGLILLNIGPKIYDYDH